jgi:hypothetical protein
MIRCMTTKTMKFHRKEAGAIKREVETENFRYFENR